MNRALLFEPITIRGLTLKNRIVVSPMCQYSAHEGFVNEWHFGHHATLAKGGAALVFVEATAIERRGRITHGCTGLWSDDHVEGMAKIAEIIKSHGGVPAIQLAHAGRKGSVQRPWHGNDALTADDFARGEMNWEVVSSVEEPMFPHWQRPKRLSVAEIGELLLNYKRATRRALEAGFEAIEIHGAHGYLLNQFWSPLCNERSDDYGGSFEKRMRLPLEVTEAVRGEWPEAKPLFYRCSALDESEGGITIDDTVALGKALKERGVDVIDCSAGGIARASATMGGGREGEGTYVGYAREVKQKGDVMTMAVKLIHRPEHAEDILRDGSADLIAIGRELLRQPNWPLHAAEALGVDPELALWPPQHGWWLVRRKRAEGF